MGCSAESFTLSRTMRLRRVQWHQMPLRLKRSMKLGKCNSPVDVAAVLERIGREGPDGLLSRAEAAAIIAARTRTAHDTPRTARNRVGRQLDLACGRGDDVHANGLSRRPDRRYTVDEIARWARINYPAQFDDLPTKPRAIWMHPSEQFGLRGTPSLDTLPGDPIRKDAEILRLRAQLAHAFRELGEFHRRQGLGERFKKK